MVNSLANNISMDGINIISNFQPLIGSVYKIYLTHGSPGRQKDFEIEITRVEVEAFNAQKYPALAPGLFFSIGARFKT